MIEEIDSKIVVSLEDQVNVIIDTHVDDFAVSSS